MSTKPKVVLIFGTGPEAIKLFPVVRALSQRNSLEPVACVTTKHRQMLYQLLDIADIRLAYDVDLMILT